MERRDFLQAFAASAALALTGCGNSLSDQVRGQAGGTPSPGEPVQPHLILVTVDQLRYPVHFPAGVDTPDQFIERFMPNLYRHIWRDGVKFDNHQIAAAACTPSRGVMLSGLYAQQTWALTTITGSGPGGSEPPGLASDFPTYGRLLREAGYQTPYFGKFHVTEDYPLGSAGCTMGKQDYLEPWGFQSFVCPDVGGSQGQGEGGDGTIQGDEDVADLAIGYLGALTADSPPICATVSFINPHDYEYFWGGTEPDTYTDLFADAGATPLVAYDPTILQESNPAPQGFPAVPSNWEHIGTLAANKPRSQVMFNEANQAIFSAVSFEPSTTFEIQDSPIAAGAVKKGVAPFSYWQRGQDAYVSIVSAVDEQIGRALDAIPAEVLAKSVIVFTSDHGDYVGSHGFLQNKVGTGYAEALRVPLVVRDHTGRFATEPATVRSGLTSSVDLLRLMVDLGNNGSSAWIQGDLATLYESRHRILDMVASATAPGRDYACFTTDEFVQPILNFNASPTHIMALLKAHTKLVAYSFWRPASTDLSTVDRGVEFYDYTTAGGRAETDNRSDDPRVPGQLTELFDDLLQNEIRKPLPPSLVAVQAQQEQAWIDYADLLDNLEDALSLGNVQLSVGGGL